MSNSGGTGANGGRAMGGRASGGQFVGGAPTFGGIGGIPSVAGGKAGFGGGPGQCSSNQECSAISNTLKYCDSGLCVECRDGMSGQCLNPPRTLCSPRDTCVECLGPQHCDDPSRPACDERGICRECVNDDTCKAPLPACDMLHNNCEECVSEGGGYCRDPLRSHCDTKHLKCVECTKQSDCQFGSPSASWCMNNTCMCDNDEQCVGSPFGSHCISSHCRECGPGLNCPDGATCDSNSGKCLR